MFRYKSLQWHTPYISGGKPHGPATAGVNAYAYVYDAGYYKFVNVGFNVDNDPASILEYKLMCTSNVGVPGLFVYALN